MISWSDSKEAWKNIDVWKRLVFRASLSSWHICYTLSGAEYTFLLKWITARLRENGSCREGRVNAKRKAGSAKLREKYASGESEGSNFHNLPLFLSISTKPVEFSSLRVIHFLEEKRQISRHQRCSFSPSPPLCSIFCCRFDVFLLFTPFSSLLILGAPEKGPVSMYIHEIPTWRKWISGPIITTGLDERASSHLGVRRLENCPDGVWELYISQKCRMPKV